MVRPNAHALNCQAFTVVRPNAHADVAVTRVELYLDDTPIGTDTTAPYSIGWDTANVPDGHHTLLARAYDAAGNISAPGDPVTLIFPTKTNQGKGKPNK